MLAKDLPIYAQCFELADVAIRASEEMPRFYRYTVGQRMFDKALSLFQHVIAANRYTHRRQEECESIITIVEELGVMYRILERKKVLSLKHRAQIGERLAQIGRQANGWKKQ